MGSKFTQVTKADRIKIETLLNAGHKVSEIAKLLNFHRSTIYREINRGKYMHLNSDYTETEMYSSDLGQKVHDYAQEGKGRSLKIGKDIELADYIEAKIVNEKYSPEAALASVEKSNINFKTTISLRTLYRYIDNGIFLMLTNKDLPIKGKRKKHNKKVRIQKRASAGTSIERRPSEIGKRDTFGHWEMDTVKGKRGVTKSCLLVLTERKTREEIVIKLKDQKDESVVAALDRLEHKWGDKFYQVFKTITVDNGVEFSDFEGLERSAVKEGNRTYVFYCHAYSSWERGSNENNNRLVRRHVPKGTNFDDITDEEIEYIEEWINNYPRGIFGYKTSSELFEEELMRIV
jgi:IS30 family transposase